MTRRLHIWWLAAVALASILTTPRVTPETSDRAFEDLLRGSRLFGACHRASRFVRAAWPDARVGGWSRWLQASWATLPGAERVRLAAASVAIAGATALVLGAAGPAWVAPFTWVLPLVFASVGCIAFFAAEAMARAISAKLS
jgi:hypothetical protein